MPPPCLVTLGAINCLTPPSAVTLVDSRKPRASLRADAELLPVALARDEWLLLASGGMARAALPGEQLFRRGDDADSMYLIDTGEVRLSFEDGMADKVLGPGQYFGELSVFVGQHQRFASAVVEAEGMLFEVSAAGFQKLLEREPAVVSRFMQRSFSYLVAGEQQLMLSLRRRNEDLMQTLDTLRQTRSELSVAQHLVRSDDLTGLVWLKNANCTDTVGGVIKSSGILSWTNALTWTSSLAAGNCGLTDGSNSVSHSQTTGISQGIVRAKRKQTLSFGFEFRRFQA